MLTGTALGGLLLLLLLDLGALDCQRDLVRSSARAWTSRRLGSVAEWRRGTTGHGSEHAGSGAEGRTGRCSQTAHRLCEHRLEQKSPSDQTHIRPLLSAISPPSSSPRCPSLAPHPCPVRDPSDDNHVRARRCDTYLRADLTGTSERAVNLTHVDWNVSCVPLWVSSAPAIVRRRESLTLSSSLPALVLRT
jgi:hypothetical protein